MKFKGIQKKLIIALVLMMVVLAVALTASIAKMYRATMEEHYREFAFDTASIAAGLIDGDAVVRYRNTGRKDAYYEEIQNYLQTATDTTGAKYFYVIVPEDDHVVYIWDTGEEGGVCRLLETEVYYGDSKELLQSAVSGENERIILVTNTAEYGYIASAYVPIRDSAGKVVAFSSIDLSMDAINDSIRSFIIRAALVTALLLLVICCAYFYYIRRTIIRPVRTLQSAAAGLVQNGLHNLSDFHLELHSSDEFEDLSGSFNYMAQELDVQVKNLAAVTAEKERIGAELSLATEIQASMLPRIFPPFPERKEIELYASMTPAKEVGGDFYDFFTVDNDHIAFVMADVSGKGVPAALFMVIAKTMIKNTLQAGCSPKEALERVNNQLSENNEEAMFVTAWLGILDLTTGTMQCANAGHEYPALCRAGEKYELVNDPHGFVLAAMPDMPHEQYELQLHPGDRLFLYTDGVPEANDASRNLFGNEKMLDVLNETLSLDPEQTLHHIKARIDEFAGETPQFDDITMLSIEFKQTT